MTSIVDRLSASRIVAVVRGANPEHAVRVAEAVVAGGITAVEITFTVPDAGAVIAELTDRLPAEILIGAGTITTPRQVDMAVASGAQFLVSPGADEATATVMRAAGPGVVLGALTPGEVLRATALGAHVVKLFPGSVGGPGYLRALRGPFPDVPFLPTGGVSTDNVTEWMRAGALAVGAGSSLCPDDEPTAGWSSVTDGARELLRASRRA